MARNRWCSTRRRTGCTHRRACWPGRLGLYDRSGVARPICGNWRAGPLLRPHPSGLGRLTAACGYQSHPPPTPPENPPLEHIECETASFGPPMFPGLIAGSRPGVAANTRRFVRIRPAVGAASGTPNGICRATTHAGASKLSPYAALQQSPHTVRQRTEGREQIMKWSRELRSTGRGLRTALRAASAIIAPPAAHGAVPRGIAVSGAGELIAIPDFGANPGGLAMLAYRPSGLAAGAPLVVLLHGCGQDAAAFAAQGGWIALADRLGVALVLPTQSADNNRQGCFNWFRPDQVARGR